MSKIVVRLIGGNCNCLREIGSAIRVAKTLELDEVQIFKHPILDSIVFKTDIKVNIGEGFSTEGCIEIQKIKDKQAVIERHWQDIYTFQTSAFHVAGEKTYRTRDFFEYADFSPETYKAAEKTIQSLPPDYYAMHIRLGDFAERHRVVDVDKFVAKAEEIYGNGHALAVACEDAEAFARIKAVCPSAVYITKPDHVQHSHHSIAGCEADDLAELLVLGRAKYFIGTYWSSFSTFAASLCGNSERIDTEPRPRP